MDAHLSARLMSAQQPSANFFARGLPKLTGMRTIEAVRLENFRRLVDELRGDDGEEPNAPAVAAAVGISSVYAWQLLTGKRQNIDSKTARGMERAMEKPEGWMDTDFALWPFPDVDLLAQVEKLTRDKRVELQGVIRAALSDAARIAMEPPTPSPKAYKPSTGSVSRIPLTKPATTAKKSRKR